MLRWLQRLRTPSLPGLHPNCDRVTITFDMHRDDLEKIRERARWELKHADDPRSLDQLIGSMAHTMVRERSTQWEWQAQQKEDELRQESKKRRKLWRLRKKER